MVPQKELSIQETAPGEDEQTETQSARDLASTRKVDVGKFEKIFKHPSPAEHYKALYNTFSENTEQELKEWWIQSQNIERTSHREIVQQVILQNLTALNPQKALRFVDDVSMQQRDTLSRTIFSEWAELHLDDAIEAAAKLGGAQRNVALEAILKARDDLTEENRHAIAVQLKQEGTYQLFMSDAKVIHSTTDPRESLDILLNDDIDDLLQLETLVIVTEAWREQIGFEVLSKIFHSEFQEYRTKNWITAAIAQADPALAFDYAKGGTEEYELSYLTRIIVKEWARTDPLAALTAVSTIEPSSLGVDLEEEIAEVWARTNPYELIGNIKLVSEPSRMSPLERAFSFIALEDPLGAIESLSSVEDSVLNTFQILRQIVDQWATIQPEAATEWVLNNFDQEESQLQTLLEEVLPSLARRDPVKAFEIALEQPAPKYGAALELTVISQIARDGNIELAISLLSRVHEDVKADAYNNIASAMVKAGRTFEALELGIDLETQQQRYFYAGVIQVWAHTDPTSLYASLEDLPTSAAQSEAIFELFFYNHVNPVLTDDQLEQARSLLSPDDAANIEKSWFKVDRRIP
ncbi:MAG: hypothetical protein OXH31_00815 [Gammaproteobacteria bacterium]|nr:hypothetical protein [Gammaproteobacteria bacterium]